MTPQSDHIAPDIPTLERRLAAQPASPLFARLAAGYIDANRPAQALKTCLQGMRRYPEYPTGLLMIARAQVMLRQYSDARETLHELLRILPACRAATALLDRMKDLELEYPPYTASAGSYFVQVGLGRDADVERSEQFSRQDDILPDFEIRRHGFGHERDASADEAEQTAPSGRSHSDASAGRDAAAEGSMPKNAAAGSAESTPKDASTDAAGNALQDAEGATDTTDAEEADINAATASAGAFSGFDLANLASRLENARIPALPEDESPEEEPREDEVDVESVNLDARPITETLIDIYIQQGKIREAIDALQRLAVRHPDRREEFTTKIRTLEQRLDDAGQEG